MSLALEGRIPYHQVVAEQPSRAIAVGVTLILVVAACTTSPESEEEVMFASISAAGSSTCALSVDGSAYCWGGYSLAALGAGSTAELLTPVAPAGRRGRAHLRGGEPGLCARHRRPRLLLGNQH